MRMNSRGAGSAAWPVDETWAPPARAPPVGPLGASPGESPIPEAAFLEATNVLQHLLIIVCLLFS